MKLSQTAHFFLLIIIFLPRLLNLDVFLTPDEPLFLKQAQQFAIGLSTGDFSQTLGIGYPAVTVAWWSAPAVSLAQTELGAYTAGRFANGIITGLLLLLIYALACHLLGRRPAFIGVSLLALDPYTLAYSRLLHLEVALAFFMTLTGLAYLIWLRDQQTRWLWLTGLFSGLALLTKSPALILVPMLIVMLLAYQVKKSGYLPLHAIIFSSLFIAFIASVVFFALWPAMWIDTQTALRLTFDKLLTDKEAGAGNLGLFWFGKFVEDPGPAFYPVAFLLKSTPWLLIGLLLNLWFLARNLTQIYSPSLNSICLWLFALSYLIIMTVASKKSVRYLLPAFPTFYLLIGLAFHQYIGQSSWNRNKLKSLYILPILLLMCYHPYYFTYYNPLLLGWRWAPQTILVGWGEGLDEAARYINQQPEGTVAVWYDGLFRLFYHGNGKLQAVVPAENCLTADHVVFYINQVQRNIPNPNLVYYFRTRRQPEYTVRLNGIDYAWLYRGPIVGFKTKPLPQYSIGGEFGNEAKLLGYDLSAHPMSGKPFIVTLYWQAIVKPSADRFIYVRLVDMLGNIYAKSDSPPVMGLWPTSRWHVGMFIEDAHELSIPPETAPGSYRLEVGFYDPQSGQPLKATGQPLGNGGGLLLGEVEIMN